MTAVSQPCRAVAKSGAPCKNAAQHGQEYCYAHRRLAQTASVDPATTADVQPAGQPQAAAGTEAPLAAPAALPARRAADYDLLLHELDSLIQELQRQIPGTSPVLRLFSRQGPAVADDDGDAPPPASSPTLELLVQLRDSILESTVQDMLDPETWKGFWLVTQVALQAQVDEATARLDARMEAVPGYRTVRELARGVRNTLGGQARE